MKTSLVRKIETLIKADGPMPISSYFNMCLADPQHGYYKTRDPLGAAGDFTTAPEISQLFGELIGVFLVETWQRHGCPSGTILIEGGPGRGTMMADILKTIKQLAPNLYQDLSVFLLETSPTLRVSQAKTLKKHTKILNWIADLSEANPGFTLFVANELFDAIPTRQFIKTKNAFFERVVTLSPTGRLTFGVSPSMLDPAALPKNSHPQPEGTVFELAPAREALMFNICERLNRDKGSALIIDYGHLESHFGDTLQALRRHQFDPPLENPGEADLTSHVDFQALSEVAHSQNLHVHPPMQQGSFLAGLGLGARASILGRDRDIETQQAIIAAARRLAGNEENEMGDLFKVLAISSSHIPLVPFDRPD